MSRLVATLRHDVLLQYRYKLIAVSIFMVFVWGGSLSFVPNSLLPEAVVVVPAFLVINVMVTTFYFICGLVLFEKGEDVLRALVTTPLREGEYLASKVISLTLLGSAEGLLIVALLFGIDARWGPLLAGVLLLGAVYTLLGFVAVARYDSLSEFLMPSVVLVTALQLPLLSHFGLTGRLLFVWHPIEPALVLMRAAYAPVVGWELAYGVLAALGWLAVSYLWARHQFDRFVIRAAGA